MHPPLDRKFKTPVNWVEVLAEVSPLFVLRICLDGSPLMHRQEVSQKIWELRARMQH